MKMDKQRSGIGVFEKDTVDEHEENEWRKSDRGYSRRNALRFCEEKIEKLR